ncbi:hypothetical protein Aph02nite_17110 [Actinoplanes philippinensis]|uniref:Uncharacterized protein n=1 Tax=Actinoplanes philippinensis TaxID=35752 RepID=A0A1I2B969_9ACTN|nr:hypothetical protein [Actinoplanes philippinensis]GIE75761.1 hypothetical protein Aph02nite_17110 [Actinoplanes philippinensis]SFE52527.1 hypothetical protein SAMN05421541_102175 [Actinoplanes philippinensis]
MTSAEQMPFTLTADEQADVERRVAELHECGYATVDQHVDRDGTVLKPGRRIRHAGHRYVEAILRGTGYIVAVTEKPDSAWSRVYGMPDVEMVTVYDTDHFGGRLATVAQYHVAVVEAGEAR